MIRASHSGADIITLDQETLVVFLPEAPAKDTFP